MTTSTSTLGAYAFSSLFALSALSAVAFLTNSEKKIETDAYCVVKKGQDGKAQSAKVISRATGDVFIEAAKTENSPKRMQVLKSPLFENLYGPVLKLDVNFNARTCRGSGLHDTGKNWPIEKHRSKKVNDVNRLSY